MQYLQGKKVLLIAPKFFGYEKEIKKTIEKAGATVKYFDERPENDFFTKASIRLNIKFLVRKKILAHFDSIIAHLAENTYDYILVINAETMTEKFIAKVRKYQPSASLILYMWDSVKNKPNTVKILDHFDKKFTFDPEDVELINEYRFLPLFYIPIYENIRSNYDTNFTYDLSFIGTAHGDRYKVIKSIKENAKKKNIKIFIFLYLQSKILFYYKKYVTKELKSADISDFSFVSMKYDHIIDVIKKSKVVLDIESPYQVGLTMRTIEMLGAGKKVMTTNKNIIKYDFYDENNIFVMERENPALPEGFFIEGYNNIDSNIVENYSLESWIKKLFLSQ